MASSFVKSNRKALLGRKIGMTQVFKEDVVVPVTVVEVGPCTVLQVKTEDNDGYTSLQLGFDDTKKSARRPQLGHFLRSGSSAKRVIREVPAVDPTEVFRVPLKSEVGGTVTYRDLEEGETFLERRFARTKIVQRVVIGGAADGDDDAAEGAEAEEGVEEGVEEGESEGPAAEPEAAKKPGLLVKDSSGKVLKEYDLPAGSSIEVDDGTTVADGDVIAFVPPEEAVDEIEPGVQLGINLLEGLATVDITGITKGRGFQGCIKRHGFASGDKSHGSKNVREPGSTGMHTDPGRVFKGKKMPGQMGSVPRKTMNLEVVEIDRTSNLLLVKGSVPGPNGGYVVVQESLKKG